MAKFSEMSKKNLSECHPDLQRLFNEVIKHYDCTILDGHRGEKEQNDAFNKGYSKLRFPNSKHNSTPSMAVDALPYPVDYNDHKRNFHFAGFVEATAKRMGINIRQGLDWDSDHNFKEHSFSDEPHVELL